MKHEQGPPSEEHKEPSSEATLFEALSNAFADERRIMDEMDIVFDSTPDKAEAERLVCEKFADSLDQAMQYSQLVLKRWLASIRK